MAAVLPGPGTRLGRLADGPPAGSPPPPWGRWGPPPRGRRRPKAWRWAAQAAASGWPRLWPGAPEARRRQPGDLGRLSPHLRRDVRPRPLRRTGLHTLRSGLRCREDSDSPPPATRETRAMAVCETCGNDYDKAFTVSMNGRQPHLRQLRMRDPEAAPTCDQCGVRNHRPRHGGRRARCTAATTAPKTGGATELRDTGRSLRGVRPSPRRSHPIPAKAGPSTAPRAE